MSIRKPILILCITISILAVLEVIARILLSNVYNRQFDSSLIEEHKYGSSSGLKGNATGTVWGKPFHTDDMGGRKAAHPKKGKQKILVIGDSVTEGVGVDDSATFASLGNDTLNDLAIEVRNVSLIGWSVNDYRNVVDHFVRKDTAIKAVYIFYCLNDIYGKTPAKDLPSIAHKGFMSKINAVLQDRYATYKLIKLVVFQNSNYYYQYDRALYSDSDKVNAVMADLNHMRQLCDSNQIVFGVFILPYRSQLQSLHDNFPQQVLISHFKKEGINYLDLLPDMAKAGDPKSLYLFADEIHLSDKGHKAVADAIFRK